MIRRTAALHVLALLLVAPSVRAQTDAGEVLAERRITEGESGFVGRLSDVNRFGSGVAPLGDLNGDGVQDVAVGAPGGAGAVWILFLDDDGTVASEQQLASGVGGLGMIPAGTSFGFDVAALGDLDGDDVTELAVGAPGDDDGGLNHGAVWILFLNTDGTVKARRKISALSGGFTGMLERDSFGFSVEGLGDLDGDGTNDVAVGAPLDDDGGDPSEFPNLGAVWILFLKPLGAVDSHQKISDVEGGFSGFGFQALDEQLGWSLANLGDLDGDDVVDLAVGALADDDGGAVWILFMNDDGTVKSDLEIQFGQAGFTGVPAGNFTLLGTSVSAVGDLDDDGVVDLAVGARWDDDGGTHRGAVWILFLNTDGTVKDHFKIGQTSGGFGGTLADDDELGVGIGFLGDLSGDGTQQIAVGARGHDGAGTDRGAVWMLSVSPGFAPGTWVDLGQGLPSPSTTPALAGFGALEPGAPFALVLDDGAPGATGFLCAGLAAANLPFKGGVLVPDLTPPGFFAPFPTGATGELFLGASWPDPSASGVSLWWQIWIQDPAGPFGFTATNAVVGTTP